MQVRNTMPSAIAAEKNKRTLAAAYPSFMRVLRGPVFIVCSIIVIITGGSIASVRAAERSLPGDAFYLVKLVAEQTQLVLTPSVPDRMKLKAEFTKRRVLDLKTVIASPDGKEKTYRVRQATDILKQDLRTLKEQLNTVRAEASTSRAAAEAAKVLDQDAVDVVRSLQETRAGLDEGVDADIQQTVTDAQAQAADLAINALGILVSARNGEATKDIVSADDISASVAAHRSVAAETAANVLERTMVAGGASSTSAPAPANASGASSTGTAALAKDAQLVLGEVEQLLSAAKVDEAIIKLQEGSSKSFLAQSQAEALMIAAGIATSSSTISAVTTTASGISTTSSKE